ncbi:MAG TPA: NAD(P)-binding domain-containing protein [Thermoplasmata archaeon]|nr:NAD(P)-binding domain-containing protein [Thermoplasmata archaeon]
MKVGILGSGDVAKALGTGFITAGHTVRLGSRTPESEGLVAWKKKVGANGSTASFSDTAQWGEMLVLATRGVENASTLQLAGPKHFAGKVVIDVTNPLIMAPNSPPALAVGLTDSAGEGVQRLLPGAKVVKAFNSVGNTLMFRPQLPGGPPTMFYCGNDAGAKHHVAEILTAFGWESIDVGGIEASRFLEPLCLLWVSSAMKAGNWNIAFKILKK